MVSRLMGSGSNLLLQSIIQLFASIANLLIKKQIGCVPAPSLMCWINEVRNASVERTIKHRFNPLPFNDLLTVKQSEPRIFNIKMKNSDSGNDH